MSKIYNVGLVGVGAVGAEMLKVLKDRNFPCGKVQVFASRERDEMINGETYHVLKAGEVIYEIRKVRYSLGAVKEAHVDLP